jgi:hypothetical protein
MRNSLNVLLDDRALIQVRGDVVGRSANQLHSALMRLMVWLGPLEARQKRMMDVDAAT